MSDEASDSAVVAERVSPPVPLLVLALAAVALSAALLFTSAFGANVVGYLAGSVLTIALIGAFHRIDLQRRQQPLYMANPLLTRYAGLLVALGIVISALHTWAIATELAK